MCALRSPQGLCHDHARLAQLNRARVTQIMALKFLAPAIQEEIAWLPNSHGKDQVLEKDVRRIALLPEWEQQQDNWQRLIG